MNAHRPEHSRSPGRPVNFLAEAKGFGMQALLDLAGRVLKWSYLLRLELVNQGDDVLQLLEPTLQNRRADAVSTHSCVVAAWPHLLSTLDPRFAEVMEINGSFAG